MMNIKPTIREVKVILNALGIDRDAISHHWNDTRVRGGRIKFYSRNNIDNVLPKLNDHLVSLFPDFKVDSTSYGRNVYTIHFKEMDATFDFFGVNPS